MRQRIGAFIAVFFLFFCGLAWHLTQKLPKMPGSSESELGIDFFPFFCIVIIAFLAVLLLARSLVFPLSEKECPPPVGRDGIRRILLLLALMGAYALSYEWLGFYAGTYLFGVAVLLILGQRRPVVTLIYPALLVGAVWGGFVQILGVVLPEGELFYHLFISGAQ